VDQSTKRLANLPNVLLLFLLIPLETGAVILLFGAGRSVGMLPVEGNIALPKTALSRNG